MLANFRLNIRSSTSKSDILFFRANKALGANILHQGYLPSQGEIGNSGWKIKWFAPFRMESFTKYGLQFEATEFFYSLWSVTLISISLQRVVSHLVKFYSFMFMHKISSRVVCVNRKQPRFRIYLTYLLEKKERNRMDFSNSCYEIKILLDFS